MLALSLGWTGHEADPNTGRRLARTLAAGTSLAAQTHRIGPGIIAATLGQAECVRAPDASMVLFDGWLQNRQHLRATLSARPSSDAALYASAWEKWGEETDRHVIGDYAAIIVSPAGQRVRLVRSPIQAPPLRWHRGADQLLIASISRALFALGTLRPEIDEQKIADSLYLNYADVTRDWYRGITRVAVGSQVVHTREGARAARYYDLQSPPLRLRRDRDYVEAASALLTEGIAAALSGGGAPALALSGGLDSQAVGTHLLPLLSPDQPVLALTGVPEPGWDGVTRASTRGDERAEAASLARRHPQVRHLTVDGAGASFDRLQGAMFVHAGGPPRNALNLPWLHDLYARARAEGYETVFTGAFGNLSISFDGEGALAGWLGRGRLWRLARELSHAAAPWRSLVRDAVIPNLPAAAQRGLMVRHRGPAEARLPLWCPLLPDHAAAHDVFARADEDVRPASSQAFRRALLDEASGEGGDIVQALQLIHGVQLRDPTAYRPLVEFCMAIPDEQFRKGGVRRRLAKRMLRGRVDQALIDDPRTGEQAADWHLRLGRERAALQAELGALRADPDMASRLDLDRLSGALDAWPVSTPIDERRHVLQLALPRALTTARFVRWVEGGNRLDTGSDI